MAIDRVSVQLQTPCNLPIQESLRVQLLNYLSVGHADLVRHRRLRRVEKHPGYDSRTPHHWPVFRRPSLAGFGVPADTTASLPPPTLRLLPAAMTNLPGGVHTHWKNKTFARRTPRSGSQRVARSRAQRPPPVTPPHIASTPQADRITVSPVRRPGRRGKMGLRPRAPRGNS
jgi:hypothetical protein